MRLLSFQRVHSRLDPSDLSAWRCLALVYVAKENICRTIRRSSFVLRQVCALTRIEWRTHRHGSVQMLNKLTSETYAFSDELTWHKYSIEHPKSWKTIEYMLTIYSSEKTDDHRHNDGSSFCLQLGSISRMAFPSKRRSRMNMWRMYCNSIHCKRLLARFNEPKAMKRDRCWRLRI